MAFQQSGERSGSDSQASRLPACSPGGTACLPGRRGGEWFSAPVGEGAKAGRCLCE